MFFKYSNEEIEYLKKKCKKLSYVIDKVGIIQREVDSDIFSSVIHNIIAQQISTKAQETIWNRVVTGLGVVNVDNILNAGIEGIQSFGISFRKSEYILNFANMVKSGEFNLSDIWHKNDENAIKEFVKIKGVGIWTAEMLLLFSMGRKNIFSFDDLGIQRGLRMVYHHKKITKPLFEKYKKRFSPYCSIASLYLWEVAGGKIEEFKDFA